MLQFPQRRSIRLPGFDYSQANYYFITICTQQRQNLFGHIIEGKMLLNKLGKIVKMNGTISRNVLIMLKSTNLSLCQTIFTG